MMQEIVTTWSLLWRQEAVIATAVAKFDAPATFLPLVFVP